MEVYLDILKNSLLVWMAQKFGLDNMVLTQDSTPCHVSKATQTFFDKREPFFVKVNSFCESQISIFSSTFEVYFKQKPMFHHSHVSTV